MFMRFGKYKGKPIRDIPTQYLRWCQTIEMPNDLRDAIEDEIEWRSDDEQHAGQRQRHQTPPAAPSPIPAGLSIDMATEIVSAGRKALARRYHPDMGGDHRAMQRVNQAADFLETVVRAIPEGGAR